MKKFIRSIDGDLLADLIAGRPQPKYIWLQRTWLVVLFLAGLYLWGHFLNWGRGPLNFHDWAGISGPRLAYMRQSMIQGELPLHASAQVIQDDVTRRFLAIPDLILSPQILLLYWLDIGRFALAQFWLLYALGFWALLLLRRRFGLSLLAFTILFTLFNFNGHILAHATVGHATWGGYFLFPAFAVLIFELLEEGANWRWAAKVVFLALLILLQGSYHQFMYLLFFLGLLVLSVPRHFWWLAASVAFAVLVAMWRILPAAFLLAGFDNDFLAGFPFGVSIWQYLTQAQIPQELPLGPAPIPPIGTWEYTFYIGIISALFILYFGVLRILTDREAPEHFRLLLLPCLGLTLLSLHKVFLPLRTVLPIPPFTSERVAARIFSLAFVFILILATVQFQRWLEKNRPSLAGVLAMLALFAVAAYDLLLNLFAWGIPHVTNYFLVEDWLPERYYPANQYTDTKYFLLLAVGLLVSLLSAALLLYLAWRERRNLKDQIRVG